MTDVSAPIGQPFTNSLFQWVPGLGLALVLDVVVPEQSRGAREAEISFQISPLAGVWTVDLAVW